jgi:hypothetical protein
MRQIRTQLGAGLLPERFAGSTNPSSADWRKHLGNTGRKTGFWLEELAAPYYVFEDAGAP